MPSTLLFPIPPVPQIPVSGTTQVFPVHRVYCVGRNYADHAVEMGFTGREPPFFFTKPADAVVVCAGDTPTSLPYPTLTSSLHHEVELVVALDKGGSNIDVAQAMQHVFGYAVGLDMTRRDLQNEMKKQGRPWCIGKAFEGSAPISALLPAVQAGAIEQADIRLDVNGETRQQGNTNQLIWNIAEIIAELSRAWTLQPGDLIYTGTPAGVGAVKQGDLLEARIDGLPALAMKVF